MKMRKVLTMVAALALTAALAIGGTLAYLKTETKTVTNTFTIGKVAIDLKEHKTNVYGDKIDANGDVINEENSAEPVEVTANSYKLVPGDDYDKDPFVKVQEGSEASYVFIYVTNGIADIESTESTYKNIATQITDNGWKAVDGNPGYYYKEVTAVADDNDGVVEYQNLPIFSSFTISGEKTATDLDAYKTASIVIKAFAIQQDNLTVSEAFSQKPADF